MALALGVFAAGCGGGLGPTSAAPLPSPFVVAVTATPPPASQPPPAIPSATATADPFAGWTIADLAARSYGGGDLRTGTLLADTSTYTRQQIEYDSDGLRISGFLDAPKGEGPFPVVLVLHGYVPPEAYTIVTYTARYAAALAQQGFLVIHPNYRGYPPSDDGPNLFRVGFAIDVLNLAAHVREQAGEPGPFEDADAERIALFGHSMGGGITLRVITLDPAIRAAVLYGSMSGNERWNYEKILEWSEGERGAEELAVAETDMARIGAINYLERIQAQVSVHHGQADATVPPAWSTDLCGRLQELGKIPECYFYPGQPHTFYGDSDALFLERVVEFFNRTMP